MMEKYSKFISGSLAFGIYFALIGVLLFYFNVHKAKKNIHYVEKNEHRIQVSISSPMQKTKSEPKTAPRSKPAPKPQPTPIKKPEPKPVPKPEPKPVPKPEPKPTPKPVPVEKPLPKEKVAPKVVEKPMKKPEQKKQPPKAVKTSDLFAKVNTPEKKNITKPNEKPVANKPVNNLIKVSDKPSASDLVSNSLKIQKNSDSGVENAYFAKVEKILQGWPAQSEFAGEKAKVWFKVQVDGSFQFRIVTGSSAPGFNEGLEAYLMQLQKIGFGPHQGGRPYELDVEFEANE
ncbi:MAG: hypothetical protein QG564_1477 [Campylobacterota bacterium]|nr:hypothetical protein [Campylobacterota bacterium]